MNYSIIRPPSSLSGLLLGSLIFLWPAVVARGRRWGARWHSVLEAAREFLPWRLCAALGKGWSCPRRCHCFLWPTVEAKSWSGRRHGRWPPPSSFCVAFNDFVLVLTPPTSWPAVAARGRTVVLCCEGDGAVGLILTPMLRPIGATPWRPTHRRPHQLKGSRSALLGDSPRRLLDGRRPSSRRALRL
jgi:hypothetical protein